MWMSQIRHIAAGESQLPCLRFMRTGGVSHVAAGESQLPCLRFMRTGGISHVAAGESQLPERTSLHNLLLLQPA